ncbi:lipase family protein [Gordonia sp. (in: high G+C Gram-positive bacteria)]|uniref:lipase family protein n=1 Tax=Gordonia sp. (in: high G+C Gram-positive bacteria) TaxID=84139 RepID=UPI0016AA172E|nr:lipase family protein [Gordonia sp. (in: high G+C Gram-positive bacteria)]NLG46640.1 alpha/beta hydrolase [Gordonia sp. (in: high G+C Gram-positive bacteria)]
MISAPKRFVRNLCVTAAAAAVAAGTVTGAYALADPQEAPPAPGGQTAGSVFANRTIDPDRLVSGASSGQQYSYWSEGSDERLHLTTAVLLEPKGATPSAGWPVVVWAHGSDGWNESCSPSRNNGGDADDRTAMNRLLKRGYAVIAPDYAAVGAPGAPQYSDVDATAHNLVDAVRAAADIGQASLSPKWAVVGQAQGAAAAISLARNATAWQTGKLDFRGATATSVPGGYDDVVAGLSPSSSSVPTAVVADVLYTLASQDPAALEPILTKRGAALVEKAKTLCTAALIDEIGNTQLAGLVSRPLSSNAALAGTLRKSLTLPTRGFSRPVLMSQRLIDDTVVVPNSLRYLTEAQLTSNKVKMSTYLTGDVSDAKRQEQAVVDSFLDDLY